MPWWDSNLYLLFLLLILSLLFGVIVRVYSKYARKPDSHYSTSGCSTVATERLVAHLAQHPATGGPAQALTQTIEEPESREDSDGGGPGEEHIDASHHEQTNGEEPTSADLV